MSGSVCVWNRAVNRNVHVNQVKLKVQERERERAETWSSRRQEENGGKAGFGRVFCWQIPQKGAHTVEDANTFPALISVLLHTSSPYHTVLAYWEQISDVSCFTDASAANSKPEIIMCCHKNHMGKNLPRVTKLYTHNGHLLTMKQKC